jgi:hypothetical protein
MFGLYPSHGSLAHSTQAPAGSRSPARPLLPLSSPPTGEYYEPSGVVCILQRELCDLYSTLDRKYMLGVPSRTYYSVLGWLGWHYSALLSQPITSLPPLDVGQSEQWATVCYNKLCAVDLRPVTRKAKRPQSDLMMAHVFDQAPALRTLEPTLTDHSGLSSILLSNTDGRRLLRQALDLDALTFPEPADNSIGRHTDARCAICKNVDNDAWHATDPGLVCHNCLACKQWWHLECLPGEERERPQNWRTPMDVARSASLTGAML